DHRVPSAGRVHRLVRLAVSAMKHSLRASLPAIHGVVLCSDMSRKADEEHRFLASASGARHLVRAASPKRSYCVLIGPEGDFSSEEMKMAQAAGFLPVNLGPARLRTETAGLAAVHSLTLANL